MGIVRCMVKAEKFIGGHGSFLMNGRLSQVVESRVKVFVDSAFSLGSSVVGCGGVVRDLERNVLEVIQFMDLQALRQSYGVALWGVEASIGFRIPTCIFIL